MNKDIVDNLLIQWEEERPDLCSDSLGIVVRVLHLAKLLSDRASQALAEIELSLWEYDVLSTLRRQGEPFRLSATDLSIESRLSTGAMTNRIDKLEDRRLVRRISDKRDRRSIQIELTSKGRELMSEALELRLATAEDSLQDLTMEDRSTLAKLLRRIMLKESSNG